MKHGKILLFLVLTILAEGCSHGGSRTDLADRHPAMGRARPDADREARAYFEAVAKETDSEVSLSELLSLWRPSKSDPAWALNRFGRRPPVSWIQECREGRFPFRPSKEQGEYLDKNCAPDVLYSWGSEAKVESFKKRMGNASEWPTSFEGNRALYMALTPSITFVYGDRLQRFKIRKGVKFLNYYDYFNSREAGCHSFPEEVKNNAIFVNHRPLTLYEFLACSPRVFESWSYDTEGNYDEIVKDFVWIRENHKRGEITRYTLYYPGLQHGEDHPILGGGIDGFPADEAGFKARLLRMVSAILRNQGEVFYSPEGADRGGHFIPRRALWFTEPLAPNP